MQRRAAVLAAAFAMSLLVGGLGAAATDGDAGHAGPPTAPAPRLPLRREAGLTTQRADWFPSLALVTFAGAGGLWVLWRRSSRARLSPGRSPRADQVVRLSSQALTPQASIHAVQWNGEELLLGCTAQQVTLLSRRPAAPRDEEAA